MTKTGSVMTKTTPLVVLLTASLANAADFVWTGAADRGNFVNTGNWTGGTLPPATTWDNIYIGSGDRLLASFDSAVSIGWGNGANPSAYSVNVANGGAVHLTNGGWGTGQLDAQLKLDGGAKLQIDGGNPTQATHVSLVGSNTTSFLETYGRFDIRSGHNTVDFGNNNTWQLSGSGGTNFSGGNKVIGTGVMRVNSSTLSIEGGQSWAPTVGIELNNGSNLTSWGGNADNIPAPITLSGNSQINGRYDDQGKTYSGQITLVDVGRFHPEINSGAGGDQWINATGKVTGPGSLNKTGAGTLKLANSTNDYTGGTDIREGKIDVTVGKLAPTRVNQLPGTEIVNGTNTVEIGNGSAIKGKITGSGALRTTSGVSTIEPATPSDVPNLEMAGGAIRGQSNNAVFSSNPVQVTATSKLLMSDPKMTLQIEGNNLDGSNHGQGTDVNAPFTPGSPVYTNNGTQTYGQVLPNQTNTSLLDSNTTAYGHFWRASYYGKIVNTGTTNIEVSFGEQYDDQARVQIDGVDALNNGGWEVATSTSNRIGNAGINANGTITITPGVHDIIIQSYDGWGGNGPSSGWNKGIGWRLGGYAITAPNTNGGSTPASQADSAAFQTINFLNPIHSALSFTDGVAVDRSVSQPFNVATGASLDVDSVLLNGGNTILNGTISGAGGLITNGNVIIGTAATYTGQTTVNAGTLRVDVGSQAGTLAGQGPIVINNGGTLLVNAVDGLGYYTNNGTNSVTINQGGALVTATNRRNSVDRNLNVIGGTVGSQAGPFDSGASYTFRDVANGTPNFYNFTSSPSGTPALLSAINIGLNGAATLTVTDGPGAIDLDITGNFVDNFGAGELKKAGSGVARLATPATHTGGTVVSAGTLLLGTSNVLPDAGALTLNGGTLATGDNDEVVGALSVTANSVLNMGTGSGSEVTFGSVSTWTGILSVWNYSGGVWATGLDKLVFTASGGVDLTKVQFYADAGVTPIGIGGGFIGNDLVPVPETTGTLASLLLIGSLAYRERRSLLHFRR
jgi:fibronectin-binding autotransporter adhesin